MSLSEPKALKAAYEALNDEGKALLTKHLMCGTSADWLAATLTRYGFTISATTIKTYRAQLRAEGVIV